jgi:RNA polymerase sigma factor (sigma-70 family)
MSDANPPTILEQISTRWPQVSDPGKFVLRYAPAIRRYLSALLRDPHAVEEVTQDLLLRVVQQRFVPEQVTRGRFRDYLKSVVRNAAFSYLRREQARPTGGGDVELLADDSEHPTSAAEREWVAEWRQCLMERVWDDLDAHQRENPASRCYSVMRLTVDHPDADSPTLAKMLSEQDGEPIKAEAFRKQLSRARRLFVRYLMRQIASTLDARARRRSRRSWASWACSTTCCRCCRRTGASAGICWICDDPVRVTA